MTLINQNKKKNNKNTYKRQMQIETERNLSTLATLIQDGAPDNHNVDETPNNIYLFITFSLASTTSVSPDVTRTFSVKWNEQRERKGEGYWEV